MRKLLVVLVLLTSYLVASTEIEYYTELTQLSKKQKMVMYESYLYGLDHDLGYTLAAIAWKESKFGLWPINVSDGKHGSFGPFHVLLESSSVRNGAVTDWDKSRLAEKLVLDFQFAANEAISELLYWQRRWENKDMNWSRTVASYNAGKASINSDRGLAYSKDILLRIKILKKYFKKNDIIQ